MEAEAQPVEARDPARLAAWAVAAAGAAGIVVVSIFGAIHTAEAPITENGLAPVGRFAAFALDTETNPATAFAALLLGVTALFALWLAYAPVARIPRAAFALFGIAFGYMAVDEWWAIHERLPALFGVSRRLYYVPAALVALVAYLVVLRGLRSRLAQGLWIAAPLIWIASQAVAEVAQVDTEDQDGAYRPLTAVEEISEMIGTYCFGLVFLLLLVERASARRATASPALEPRG